MQTPIEIYEILKAKLITNESDIAIINNILCIKPSLILLEFTFLLINACKYPVKMSQIEKIRGVIICHIKLEKFKCIKCLAEDLGTTQKHLRERAKEFKQTGCDLF